MFWKLFMTGVNIGLAGATLLYLSRKELFEARARILDAELKIEKGDLLITVNKNTKILDVSARDGFRFNVLNITSPDNMAEVKQSLTGSTILKFIRMFFSSPVLKGLQAAEKAIQEKLSGEINDEERAHLNHQLKGIEEAKAIFA